jgi:hypothetical protein
VCDDLVCLEIRPIGSAQQGPDVLPGRRLAGHSGRPRCAQALAVGRRDETRDGLPMALSTSSLSALARSSSARLHYVSTDVHDALRDAHLFWFDRGSRRV